MRERARSREVLEEGRSTQAAFRARRRKTAVGRNARVWTRLRAGARSRQTDGEPVVGHEYGPREDGGGVRSKLHALYGVFIVQSSRVASVSCASRGK